MLPWLIASSIPPLSCSLGCCHSPCLPPPWSLSLSALGTVLCGLRKKKRKKRSGLQAGNQPTKLSLTSISWQGLSCTYMLQPFQILLWHVMLSRSVLLLMMWMRLTLSFTHTAPFLSLFLSSLHLSSSLLLVPLCSADLLPHNITYYSVNIYSCVHVMVQHAHHPRQAE